jgi:hypothetical protein
VDPSIWLKPLPSATVPDSSEPELFDFKKRRRSPTGSMSGGAARVRSADDRRCDAAALLSRPRGEIL